MTALSAFAFGATIKVTIIAAVALVAVALLRERSAAARHWVLAIAVACAAVVPVLQYVVPEWHLQTMVSAGGVLATIQDLPVADTATASAGPTVVQRLAGLAVPIWLAGVAVGLVILLTGLARLTWLASRATPIVDGPWHDVCAQIARGYGLKRRVTLLASPYSSLLATWGFARPRLILPAAARDWPEARVRMVLGHELAHVRRNDWIARIAVEALTAIYWCNPLVWMLRRRLDQEAEQAADDAVLGLGVNGGVYASELVDLARTLVAPAFVPAPSMARQSGLERRIRAMLNGHLNRTPLTRTAGIVVAIALAAVTVSLAGLRAQAGPASLSGTLVDQLGAGLANVAVNVTNIATSAKATQRTDGSGNFMFGALSAGTYTVEAAAPGFKTLRSSVTLAGGENANQRITMPVGSLQETITVTSDGRNLASPPGPQPRRTPLPVPAYDPAKHGCAEWATAGCIVPPTKMVDVKPVYPWNHRDAEGVVTLAARIGSDGLLKTVAVQSAPGPDFAQSAVDAVSQWQFTPTYLDRQAIEVEMMVTLNFKVQ